MKRITVCYSSGVGRLHFPEAVQSMVDKVQFVWILGWAPKHVPKWVSAILSGLTGRKNFGERLAARRIEAPNDQTVQVILPECIVGILDRPLRLFPDGGRLPDAVHTFAWRLFGYLSRSYIKGEIFHVRSGAGQGGAIREAKRRGLKVVVDHSIAHPHELARVLDSLRSVRRRLKYGDSRFWELVLRDCEEADLVLVNSDYVKDTFLQWGFEEGKVRTNYFGVNEKFLNLKQSYDRLGKLRLLFTGYFCQRKGAGVLLEALEILAMRNYEVELVVIGQTEKEYERLGDRRTPLPVKFKGLLLQDGLLPYVKHADLYVFPSFVEGCARSAIESLVAGLPVIATAATGLPHQVPALYHEVQPGDANGLADAIQLLGGDVSLRQQYGANGKAFGNTCNWEAYSRRLAKIYEQLLKE